MEMVWSDRTPGSCREKFRLRVGTSGGPRAEVELHWDLGWERGGRFGVPLGLEHHVLAVHSSSAKKEDRTTTTNSKPPLCCGRAEDSGAQEWAFQLRSGCLGSGTAFAC